MEFFYVCVCVCVRARYRTEQNVSLKCECLLSLKLTICTQNETKTSWIQNPNSSLMNWHGLKSSWNVRRSTWRSRHELTTPSARILHNDEEKEQWNPTQWVLQRKAKRPLGFLWRGQLKLIRCHSSPMVRGVSENSSQDVGRSHSHKVSL